MPLHQISLIYSIDFIENLKKKICFYICFMCMGIWPASVSVYPVCLVPLEELAVRYHVGAGIPTTT